MHLQGRLQASDASPASLSQLRHGSFLHNTLLKHTHNQSEAKYPVLRSLCLQVLVLFMCTNCLWVTCLTLHANLSKPLQILACTYVCLSAFEQQANACHTFLAQGWGYSQTLWRTLCVKQHPVPPDLPIANPCLQAGNFKCSRGGSHCQPAVFLAVTAASGCSL